MTEEIIRELWQYLELHDTENATSHNLWDEAFCNARFSRQSCGVELPMCTKAFKGGHINFIFYIIYIYVWNGT